MALRATIPCTIIPFTGTDRYGQPEFGTPVSAVCAPVDFDIKSIKSSIRADSSASRGNAREIETSIDVLLPASARIAVEDQMMLLGLTVRVISIFPRYNTSGSLHHLEIKCQAVGLAAGEGTF